MERSMANLNEILDKHAVVVKKYDNIYGVDETEVVIDYLIDTQGKDVLKSFDETPQNIGVAMFYDCPVDCRDIVIIFRHKGFRNEADNGLFMIVYRNAHRGDLDSKNHLFYMIHHAMDDKSLSDAVVQHLDGYIMKSVQVNV